MKAVLEFTLPEEETDFKCAQKGVQYSIALEEMDNYLRARLKYEELTDEVRDALQAARDALREYTVDL